MENQTDEYILSLLTSTGNRDKGVSLFVAKYQERIYWHIRRLVISHEDAQDILQETFINAYKYIRTFKKKSCLYTWLYKIATHECLKLINSKKTNTEYLSEMNLLNCFADETLPDREALLVKFQKAIQNLPEKQRIIFLLKYYDELSYKEIAEIVNTNSDNLKSNYYYAVKNIKEYLINE
jgi:RNA polymerase sigma-70 factor, ECF subfamily